MPINTILLQTSSANFFEKILDVASHITDPISLIAFAVALVMIYFIFKNISDTKALKDNPQEYVRISERVQIDLKTLPKGPQAEIIRQILRGRIVSQIILAASIIIGGIILAWAVQTYTANRNGTSKSDSTAIKPNEISENTKTPDSTTTHTTKPASKMTNFQRIIAGFVNEGLAIKDDIISGNGQAWKKDDCEWNYSVTQYLESKLRQSKDDDIKLYLSKTNDVGCGPTHDERTTTELDSNLNPVKITLKAQPEDIQIKNCIKSIDKQIRILKDLQELSF
jgi:hypothetical protein